MSCNGTLPARCRANNLLYRILSAIYNDIASLVGHVTIRFDTESIHDNRDFKVYWGRHWFEGAPDEIDALWRNITNGMM